MVWRCHGEKEIEMKCPSCCDWFYISYMIYMSELGVAVLPSETNCLYCAPCAHTKVEDRYVPPEEKEDDK